MARFVREAVLDFPAAQQSAGAARRLVREHLDRWDVQVVDDDVVLMVSELVTNVGLHARTEATVRLLFTGDCLRVEVADGSTEPVEVRPRSPGAETGRGLMIVAALALTWGVDTKPGGKTVWFEVPGVFAANHDAHATEGAAGL